MIRIIPTLLLHDLGIVKTKNFVNPVYIGDPINAVKIFNEKEVDEILLFDISATKQGRDPNYLWLKDIVSESFMPVGYGGGIHNIDQAKKLFDIGIDKIVLNYSLDNFKLIESLSNIYGNQSIVGCLDFKKSFLGKYNCYKSNGKVKMTYEINDFIDSIISAGVGELVIQSIDREGTMKGYDLDLLKFITKRINVPVIASGGAGTLLHFRDAVLTGGASAVSAGSMFVFKGKQRGILINYPKQDDIKNLFNL